MASMGEYVIVCGGRDYGDRKARSRFLDRQHAERRIDLVVTGGAFGADALADQWAEARGIARAVFPANWKGEGRSAGHRRNERMLRICRPHRVIAFPGGPGTANMVERARAAGVEVTRYDPGIEEMLS